MRDTWKGQMCIRWPVENLNNNITNISMFIINRGIGVWVESVPETKVLMVIEMVNMTNYQLFLILCVRVGACCLCLARMVLFRVMRSLWSSIKQRLVPISSQPVRLLWIISLFCDVIVYVSIFLNGPWCHKYHYYVPILSSVPLWVSRNYQPTTSCFSAKFS